MDNFNQYIGMILDDRYKISALIGVGGSSVVMKAKDLIMDRTVAIKFLNEDESFDSDSERRFINEAKAVAGLSHKNIVGIYDIAVYSDLKYIVMEYLDGITLKKYVERKGALSWKEACYFVIQILMALEHAHGKGIVHRDIKPQNVLLLRNGTVKLTDFGIAKIPGSDMQLQSEMAIGTVNYISPEQARGDRTDFYSDIYSLGVLMYELVTGALPFNGDTPEAIAMKQINEIPRLPTTLNPDVPKGLNAIIMKALEKSPENRFKSAHAMRKAIEYLLKYPKTLFASSGEDMSDPIERTVVDFNAIDVDDEVTPETFLDEKTMKKIRKEAKRKNKLETKKIKKRNSFLSPKSNSMFPIIAGIVISFLIVFSFVGIKVIIDFFNTYISNDSKDDDGIEFVMPGLKGEKWEDIKDLLLKGEYPEAKGIKITVKSVEFNPSEDDYGTIYQQKPVEGQRVKWRKGSDYYVMEKLFVSVGRQKAVMPDVIGLSLPKAQDAIVAEKGLSGANIIHKIASDSDYDTSAYLPNQVVRTIPDPGSLMEYNGTITLYHTPNVKSKISMPDLYGMLENQAASILSSYNISYLVEKTESDLPPGYVISQSVDEGQPVERGTSVTLKITVPIPSVVVEDYSGKQGEEIKVMLEEIGIIVEMIVQDSETLEEGVIFGQTVTPETVLKKGESITLYVAHKIEITTETEPETTIEETTETVGENNTSSVETEKTTAAEAGHITTTTAAEQ